MKDGVRNSLLVALMPTATTSQILGYSECFEPLTSNLYTRETNAGNFYVMNKYLIQDLIRRDLWTDEIRDQIIYYNGRINNITDIPEDLRQLYKTVWEIPVETIIEMTVDRGLYVCQAQSMNIFIEKPTSENLMDAILTSYEIGNKNGVYYLRSTASIEAKKLVDLPKTKEKNKESPKVCKRDNPDCLSCHS